MSGNGRHRTLMDNALIYLQARPGMEFTNQAIGRILEVDLRTMRRALEMLLKTRKLSANEEAQPKTYYVPTAEQLAERDKPAEARPFRPYRVPQEMRERMDEIRAHRHNNPSFYGNNNDQAREL